MVQMDVRGKSVCAASGSRDDECVEGMPCESEGRGVRVRAESPTSIRSLTAPFGTNTTKCWQRMIA